MTVVVVGDGPVARALAGALERAGAPPSRWWRRLGGAPPSGEVVVLAVRDEAIAEAAATVMAAAAVERPPVLLHCAGALGGAEPFAALARRPAGAALLHPLRSLAGGPEDAALEGVVFAVSGDPAGRAAALALVDKLGGVPLVLDGAALARYHAAAALVSNHSVALVDAGVELLASLGLDRARATAALAALLGSTARNLGALGLPAALTGPIARGDASVVARHLAALPDEIAQLYRATARRVIEVAAHKGRAAPDALALIRTLVGAPQGSGSSDGK
jgi:predicted short-subunit dehydrogenase-like oxidoreductase (DUF2520 family)